MGNTEVREGQGFAILKNEALRRGKTEQEAIHYAETVLGLPHQSRGNSVEEKLTESFMRIPGMTREKAKIAAQL